MKTLFPPQEVLVTHLANLLDSQNAVINTSDTGTGKTLMTVELCRRKGLVPLVVCPKSVIPSWRSAFAEQGVDFLDVVNYEKLRMGSTPYGAFPSKESNHFKWNPAISSIVWDEAHKCKSTRSNSAWMMIRAKGLTNILLSATLAENPSELKAAGHLLGLHHLTNFLIWAKQMGCHSDPWGHLKFTSSPTRVAECLASLNQQLYPHCGGKLSRADMGEFFSRTSISTDPLDFGDEGAIAQLYAEVEDFIKDVEMREALDTDHPAAAALLRLLRARQKVELLKLPLLAEFIKEAWEVGRSVAVFLNFNASIVALQERLGGGFPVVWGADPLSDRPQSAKERAKSIEQFQTNQVNLILLNIQAGGVAINLHDEQGGFPRTALISPSFNAKDLHQTLGRVDRAGAKSDTIQRILFAADTVEEDVRLALERKLSNLYTLHASPVTATPPMKKLNTPAPVTATPKTPASKKSKKVEEAPPAPVKSKKSAPIDRLTKGPAHQAPDEGDHAFYGPSSLGLFERCPSYLPDNESKDMVVEDDEEGEVEETDAVEDDTSLDREDASERGTRLHKACEDENPRLCRNDDEEDIVNRTLQEVYDITEYFLPGLVGEVFKEVKLTITTPNISTFGTVDRVVVHGVEAVVFDYKFGWMPVDDALENAQAAAYTVGVFQRWPKVQRVRTLFIAPMLNQISGATFFRSDDSANQYGLETAEIETVGLTYPELVLRLDLIVSRARGLRNKEFHPGAHLCEFCGNRLRCKPLAEKYLLLARTRMGDALDLPELIDPNDVDDPDTIAKLLMLATPLEKYLSDVKVRARFLAFEEGFDIPGFKKLFKKSTRRVTDPVAAFHVLHNAFNLDVDTFFSCIRTLRLTQLEAAVYESSGLKKTEAKIRMEQELREADILSGGDEDEESKIGYLRIDRSLNK